MWLIAAAAAAAAAAADELNALKVRSIKSAQKMRKLTDRAGAKFTRRGSGNLLKDWKGAKILKV